MIRNIYDRISNAILRHRYRRLYCRLFWHYAERYSTAEEAGFHAAEAFFLLTGYEWKEWSFNFHPKNQQGEGSLP